MWLAGQAGRRRSRRPALDGRRRRSPTAPRPTGFFPFFVIDGRVLPRQLVDVFDRGEQAKVPLLAGFNSGEIRSLRVLAPPVPADAATYEKEIRERYGDLADDFLKLYPSSNMQESIWATTRDALYGWTAERLVLKQTALGVPSFLYLFDHGYPAADDKGLHAFHASELPYVFGTADRAPPNWPTVPATPAESAVCRTPWSTTGPRSRAAACPSAAGQPQWPAYGTERAYMAFEDVPRAEDAPDARHVRVQRAGGVPAPRRGRHSLALERRPRLAAAAARGRRNADDRRRDAAVSR